MRVLAFTLAPLVAVGVVLAHVAFRRFP